MPQRYIKLCPPGYDKRILAAGWNPLNPEQDVNRSHIYHTGSPNSSQLVPTFGDKTGNSAG